MAAYLEQEGETAFAGIDEQDRPAVVATVRTFQRVLRVAPDVDAAQALLSSGVTSATQIAVLGRQQFFVEATAAGLTKSEANRVFNAAEQRYAGVISLVTQLNRDFVGVWPKAIGSTADLDEPIASAVARDQSLQTLFGSESYCAAEDCTSVLSPAAYLCDLLLWLRNHGLTGPFPNALAALLDRRPDLGHLLLNCPNTEVALPYIDLVNELLEDAVSPPSAPVWKQTTRTAPELRAAPEHVNDAAYTTLAGASYPHTLPYDRVLDELRTYLEKSGVALWQLRQALLPLHDPTPAERLSVAAERLRLTAARGRSRGERQRGRHAGRLEHARPRERSRAGAGVPERGGDHLRAAARAARGRLGASRRACACAAGRGRHLRHHEADALARAARRRRARPAPPVPADVASRGLGDVGARPRCWRRPRSAAERSTATRWSRSSTSRCCRTPPGSPSTGSLRSSRTST